MQDPTTRYEKPKQHFKSFALCDRNGSFKHSFMKKRPLPFSLGFKVN